MMMIRMLMIVTEAYQMQGIQSHPLFEPTGVRNRYNRAIYNDKDYGNDDDNNGENNDHNGK